MSSKGGHAFQNSSTFKNGWFYWNIWTFDDFVKIRQLPHFLLRRAAEGKMSILNFVENSAFPVSDCPDVINCLSGDWIRGRAADIECEEMK